MQLLLLVRVRCLCETSLRPAVTDVYGADSGLQWVYDLLVSLMEHVRRGKLQGIPLASQGDGRKLKSIPIPQPLRHCHHQIKMTALLNPFRETHRQASQEMSPREAARQKGTFVGSGENSLCCLIC